MCDIICGIQVIGLMCKMYIQVKNPSLIKIYNSYLFVIWIILTKINTHLG